MSGFFAVFKRELKGYFATPLAYVFLVLFLCLAGLIPFLRSFFEIRQADLRLFFDTLPFLFFFIVPSTAMRLWAEERKSGSIELLLTLPITVSQAVWGKFVAAWAFLGIALALTFPLPLVVGYLGDPDWGQMATSYLGAFLTAGGFLAVGSFFSTLTKNQVISFILSAVACIVLYFAGHPSTLNYVSSTISPAMISVFENINLLTHYEAVTRGVIEFKDMAYFVILIGAWVYAGTLVLEERKAS